MDKVFKFVYVMIIFLSLIVVATNAQSKPFFKLPSSFFLTNILFHFSYTLFFSFLITEIPRCFNDGHCPPDMCTFGVKPKCRFTICKC